MEHLGGIGVDVRAACALHSRPYAAHREPALCGPVLFRPASGAGTREGVMRCPYHGPMTTRSRDRAIPAPPPPFSLPPPPLPQNGRAHVLNPVTYAPLDCRLLL